MQNRVTSDVPSWRSDMQAVARHQDAAAFERLFAHFGPRVKSYLLRLGLDDGQAEDALQECFARVWLKAAQYDPVRADVSTWIFTIARNHSIDVLRKFKRPEPAPIDYGDEGEVDAEAALEIEEQTKILQKEIAALPQSQREMINAAYYQELTHHEIADLTGIPLGTIKSRIRLALRRLTTGMSEKKND